MVVLSEEVPEDSTPEKLSGAYRRLAVRYGMPIDWRERVASRRRCTPAARSWPCGCAGPSRRPRCCAACACSTSPASCSTTPTRWSWRPSRPACRSPSWPSGPPRRRSRRRCGPTWRAARSPSPASRAQDYKLGGPDEERRYTCPSYELLRNTDPPRRLADRAPRRPARLPAGRGLRGGDRQPRARARPGAPDPRDARRGARVGRRAAGDRRGRRRDGPRARRRPRRAGARRALRAGRRRRLLVARLTGDPSGSCARFARSGARRRALPRPRPRAARARPA